MSSQAILQPAISHSLVESIDAKCEYANSMSMWEALVHVATQRYEELLEEEKRQKQRIAQAEDAAVLKRQLSEGESMHSDQSIGMIQSADISIGENVTVGDADDEDEEPGRLIIDEGSNKDENGLMVDVHSSAPVMAEQGQLQRETVIQPCSKTGFVEKTQATVQRQDESSQANQSVSSTTTQEAIPATKDTSVGPLKQGKLGRFLPYQIPLAYNKNMARKFPGAETRTPEQQAVRERNTIAARQSRAKMRMMDDLLQQEANNERTHNHYMKERVAGLFTYANVLREKMNLEQANFIEEFERVKQEYVPGPMRTHYARNRSQSNQGTETGDSGSPVRRKRVASSPRKLDLSTTETEMDSKPSPATNDSSETESVPEQEKEEAVLDLSTKSKQDRNFGTVLVIREILH